MKKTKAIFTVDVEEYFHARNLSAAFPREVWDRQQTTVARNVRRLLALLREHGASGTFFVLGWIAERYPDLVREISNDRHEIGSHGYDHAVIGELTREQFREDVRKTKVLLERITGQPVISYRAPCFSISKKTMWAVRILADEGYRVDSSIFPVRRIAYGVHDSPISPFVFDGNDGGIMEFPPAVYRLMSVNIPISGGGYMRVLPWGIYRRLLELRDRKYNWPFVFYTHPWEIDAEPLGADLSKLDFFSHWKHFVGLNTTEAKVSNLLKRYSFTTISDFALSIK